MSEAEDEGRLSQSEVGENQCGVILGYWDHEKTSELIQDLEQSVNLVEKKCKKLLEELIQYKKYLEKSGELDFQLSAFKTKEQKSKTSHFFSGSDPDIAFRKNLINFQKMQQVFEEKFQEKLCNINDKLTETARKIGLKNNIILFPTNHYLKALNAQTDDEEKNVWCDLLEKFKKLDFFNGKTKSDSLIIEQNGKAEFSKITKNELKLYQKLSRLSMKRKKKRKKLKGRKVVFFKRRNSRLFCKKKTPRRRQNLESLKAERKNLKFNKKNLKKGIKKLALSQRGRDRSPCDSNSTIRSQEKLNESEIEKMCKSLAGNVGKSALKSEVEPSGFKPTLGAAIRKAVPFTTCTSTSRSYNIGVNIQQLLSLSKHKKNTGVRTSFSEKVHGSTTAQNLRAVDFKQNSSGLDERRVITWTNQANIDSFESENVNCSQHKGKLWISERRTSYNFRKTRSKYTGTSAGGVLEYHKSTMSQYTNGRKSMIKSESKTAYAVGSKIMVSGCQRTDIFEIGKNNNRFENASGDGNCNDSCVKLKLEWTKVYNSFLSIYRKYISLKEKVSCNNVILADEELKSLENEIDYSIEKYKDFLRFYFKFLLLNHRLKSLKIACETKKLEPVTSFSSYCHEKLCQYKPTSTMTLKKAFREFQTLQDKIRLIND